MSGLALIYHRNGRQASGRTIEAMVAAIPHRAGDGDWTREFSSVALGYAKTTVTPEEADERQPLISPRTGCAIVADVRLDNRQDLLARLPDRPSANMSDAALILLAYEAWGAEAPRHLLGDFAFAIWDPRERRVVCARDTSGERPLYYRLAAGTFAAASEVQQLFQDPAVELAPNDERIRDYLTPWNVYQNDREQPATFYEGISLLPAGHVMVVDDAGYQVGRYWDLTPTRDIRYRHDQQYVQHFADVFVAAVSARLRSTRPIGAALSGGLDSTSIVSLAHLLFGRGLAANPGFVAFSMVFDDLECDESGFIRDVQAKYGVDARYFSPLGLVSNFDPEPRGFLVAPMKAPGDLDPVLARAAEAGTRTLLCGLLGDNCFGGSPRFFDSLLRRGRLGELARYLRSYRDLAGESAGQSLALYGLVPLLPMWLQKAFWSARARREVERDRDTLVPGWVSGTIRADLLGRHLAHAVDAERSRRFAGVERQRMFASLYPPEVVPIAGHHTVQLLRPFADRRLHELVLSVPPEQLFAPHPYSPGFYAGSKLMLRRAMREILPESVRARTRKTHFTTPVLAEIERRWPDYRAAFGPGGRSAVAARGYVDPARFWERLERMRAGDFGADGVYVVRMLNLETWLRTFDLSRAQQVTPRPIARSLGEADRPNQVVAPTGGVR